MHILQCNDMYATWEDAHINILQYNDMYMTWADAHDCVMSCTNPW